MSILLKQSRKKQHIACRQDVRIQATFYANKPRKLKLKQAKTQKYSKKQREILKS